MTARQQVQDNWSRRLYACRDHGFGCPDGCTIVKELVPVVPREVAERLARALEDAAEVIGDHAGYGSAAYYATLEPVSEFRAVFPVSGPANSPQTTVAEEA